MTQSKFTLTLPTLDNAGAPLSAGQLTSIGFTVSAPGTGPTTFTFALPAGVSAGTAVTVPFSGLSPAFAPVGGVAYSADAFAVDANGNGVPTASISWTQLTVPAAPTNFSVG